MPTVKVAAAGATTCRVPENMSESSAIGRGNVAHFVVAPGATSLQLHDWSAGDYDCEEPPILDLDVEVGAGERVLVVLYEELDGSLATLALPLG